MKKSNRKNKKNKLVNITRQKELRNIEKIEQNKEKNKKVNDSNNKFIDKIESFMEKPIYPIILLFILGVVIRFYLAYFQKNIFLYTDEILLLDASRSLASLSQIEVRSILYPFYHILYPLIIAPANIVSNGIGVYSLIKLINAILMNSAIFPVWLISRKVAPKNAVLISFLSIFIPDLCFTCSVLAENLVYPLAMWFLYFSYNYLTDIEANRKKWFFISFIFGILLFFTKAASFYFLVGFLLFIFVIFFIKSGKKIKIVSSISLFVIITLFAFISPHIFRGYVITFDYFKDINRIWALLKYSFYFLGYISAGFGITFIIIPIMFRNYLSEDNKKWLSMILFILGTAIFTVTFMVSLYEDYPSLSMTPHLRYFFPLVIPFILLVFSIDFESTKYKITNLQKIIAVCFVIFMQICIGRFPEGNYTAFMDIAYLRDSLLCPFLNYSLGFIKIKGSLFDFIKLLILIITIVFSVQIFKSRLRQMKIFAISIFIALCLINNYLSYKSAFAVTVSNADILKNQVSLLNESLNGAKVLLIGKYSASEKIFDTYSKLKYYYITDYMYSNVLKNNYKPDVKLPLISMQWSPEHDPEKAKASRWASPNVGIDVNDPYWTVPDIDYIVISNSTDFNLISKNLSPFFISGLVDYKVYAVIKDLKK